MPNLIDLTGKTFGQWKVVKRAGIKRFPSGSRQACWLCICMSCGKKKKVVSQALRTGVSSQCDRCRRKKSTVPKKDRVCRYCGKKTKGNSSQLATVCDACDRRKYRNGMCKGKCGAIAYKSRACPDCGKMP